MSSRTGVLPVDKPAGPTSHDMVSLGRRALGQRRIGHTGTLDPFASGLLLLCLGPATRLAEFLTPLPKSYSATLRLGIRTDTDDREGAVLEATEAWSAVTRHEAEAALLAEQGARLQVPPIYSAKKVAGERLYRLARRQEAVTPAAVEVVIHRIEMTRFAPPEIDFEVDCSSGTYIRAIARDVGELLGVGAHLTALRRTRIGDHDVAGALPPERLSDPTAVDGVLIDPAAAVGHLPQLTLSSEELGSVLHGGRFAAPPGLDESVPLVLLGPDGALVAIANVADGTVQPRKVFA